MLRLAALHVHPVKGARAISVDTARVTATGLADDRRWMIVDNTGAFLTQRELPRMALIDAHVAAPTEARPASLELSAPGWSAISVACPPAGRERQVEIWGDVCTSRSAGPEAARWVSELLGRECDLVYMPRGAERAVDPEYAKGARVAFADGFPFLIATAASVDALNRELAAPVDMRRFRPNLVIAGSGAWEDDTWLEIAVGDLRFELVKPCSRCSVITVDPDTGERGKEPLATLARSRARTGQVYFGHNAVLSKDGPQEGLLRVGDPVVVVRRAE